MVDKHAGQPVANGALYQGRGHGRIHTTGQSADSAAGITHLFAHGFDQFIGDIRGGPVLLQPSNLREEAHQNLLAMG